VKQRWSACSIQIPRTSPSTAGTFAPGPKQADIFKATTVCPATDQTPGITAEAEVSYKPDSYQGLGQLTVKDKAGTTIKGSSVLSGKRVGDC